MVFLTALAQAHLPHDDVVSVAARVDEGLHLAATVQASGSARAGPWALMTWDGAGWWPTQAPNTADQPVGLAWSGSTLLLLDGGGQLWSGPSPWTSTAGPEASAFVGVATRGAWIYVGTDTGLWGRTADSQAWSQLVPTAILWTGADEAHVAAVGHDGSLWLDGTELPALGDAVAMTTDGAYAATRAQVYRRTDDWGACAALPVTDLDPVDKGEIVALAHAEGELLVATGQWVYRSVDGCTSWVEEQHFPDGVSYGSGAGQIESASRVCTGVWVQDGYALVTGHRGVAVDAGDGWEVGRLLDATWLRDVSMSTGGWYAASYGAGIVVEADEAPTQIGASLPTAARFGRYVQPIDEERILYCGDLEPYWTADGGRSFSALDLPFGSTGAIGLGGGAAWAFEQASIGSGAARSFDGESWEAVRIADGSVRQLSAQVLAGQEVLLARVMNPAGVWVSSDAGDSWTALVDDGEVLEALVTWPPASGERLVRAGAQIQLSDDGGTSWRTIDAGPDNPTELASIGETLHAVDGGGVAWRSTDGGESWTEGGWIGAVVATLTGRDGVLYAATLRGLASSTDSGRTWAILPTLDALPAQDADLVCTSLSASGCLRDTTLLLEPLDELSFWTRASTMRFDGSGHLSVTLDGGASHELAAGQTLALPGSGWRQVRAVATGEVEVAQVVGLVEGEAPAPADEDPAPTPRAVPTRDRCACLGDHAENGWTLAIVALRWRRRRNPPRLPTPGSILSRCSCSSPV